ncbi:MAG: glycosyltransferase family 2 protein [Elusimicrobiota bacterium]
MKISCIIPVFNEEENLDPLYNRLKKTLQSTTYEYEIIFIDDGSADESWDLLKKFSDEDKKVRLIKFTRNYGQTAALQSGFNNSKGDIIVTLDADLQNNPEDVPEIINEIEQKNLDVVSGWRYPRKDSLSRRFVSKVANWIISRICGLKLHDFGCTLKAYRKKYINNLNLYGEMHRFIPAFIKWNGGRVGEIKVSHSPRIHGKSSYGMGRIHRVVLDLITTKFLTTYSTKPIHVFGSTGLLSIFTGILIAVYVAVRKIYLGGEWLSPLFFISVFLLGLGLILIFMGIIAEIAVRIYFSQKGRQPYNIEDESSQ